MLELILAVFMVFVLAITSVALFRAVLLSFSSSEERQDIAIMLDRGVEEMSRELRGAKVIGILNNGEIRYSKDEVSYYIYYFYNASDSYPLSFNMSEYELRQAQLSGGINGVFTYGDGKLILSNITSPSSSMLVLNGNMVEINLKVQNNEELLIASTKIRPRNL